jgi:hypothetical protein
MEDRQPIERVAERIRFLQGDVTLKASDHVEPIREVKERLIMARNMEELSM